MRALLRALLRAGRMGRRENHHENAAFICAHDSGSRSEIRYRFFPNGRDRRGNRNGNALDPDGSNHSSALCLCGLILFVGKGGKPADRKDHPVGTGLLRRRPESGRDPFYLPRILGGRRRRGSKSKNRGVSGGRRRKYLSFRRGGQRADHLSHPDRSGQTAEIGTCTR